MTPNKIRDIMGVGATPTGWIIKLLQSWQIVKLSFKLSAIDNTILTFLMKIYLWQKSIDIVWHSMKCTTKVHYQSTQSRSLHPKSESMKFLHGQFLLCFAQGNARSLLSLRLHQVFGIAEGNWNVREGACSSFCICVCVFVYLCICKCRRFLELRKGIRLGEEACSSFWRPQLAAVGKREKEEGRMCTCVCAAVIISYRETSRDAFFVHPLMHFCTSTDAF